MKLTKSRLQKIIKEEFEKFISLEEFEKPKSEIEVEKAQSDCERKGAERGENWGFNPNTGECQELYEE